MIRRGRLLSGALLLATLIVVAFATGASANHSTLELVSQGTIGGNDPFVAYFSPGGTSADGEHAFFETDEQLLPSDTDSSFDVYERFAGATSRVSFGPSGGNGAFEAFFDAVSDDGSRAFFETDEKLVSGPGGDTDSYVDIYERSGGTTTQVSTGGTAGGNGASDVFFDAISADGSKVFFTTDEKLDTSDTDSCLGTGCDDVYEHSGGTTKLVSAGGNGNFPVTFVGASDDGSRVFFETAEPLSGSDTDSRIDVYERAGGTTTLISTGTPGNGAFDAFFEGTSSDGSKVFFSTAEQLAATDTDTSIDVYERSGAATSQVSTAAGNPNGAFNATFDGNSQDGSRVFFHTREGLVGTDTDGQTDIYQRMSGSTTEISVGATGGNSATFAATFEGISANGTRVFFSTAEKLESGDLDNVSDVYQRLGSTTTLLSVGALGGNGSQAAFFDGSSADGARVFFSTSEKLEAPDTDNSTDVYEHFTGTSLISIGPNGGNGAISAFFDQASDDGTHVFFSTAESLLNIDTDTSTDIYDAGAPVGYARPKSATPMTVRLVPAFDACTSPNGSHGAPLNQGSCSPPNPSSDFLTVGTADSNGQQTNSDGYLKLAVVGESPINFLNGDQADVNLTFQLTDVRNNTSPYSDYAGELRGLIGLRITDRLNGPTQTAPATVTDADLGFNIQCATTPSTSIGGACNATTSVDTIMPGLAREGVRSVWETKQIKVFDGGPDGDADTANNTLFEVQGAFTP